jgi:hypothetical protein
MFIIKGKTELKRQSTQLGRVPQERITLVEKIIIIIHEEEDTYVVLENCGLKPNKIVAST